MNTDVWLYGQHVGVASNNDGPISFRYDPDYRGIDLSLSMPKTAPVTTQAAAAYFTALLPDNPIVLQKWGHLFNISWQNPLALLSKIGQDAPGAIQITPEGTPPNTTATATPLNRDDLNLLGRRLRENPYEWSGNSRGPAGLFSLAGANTKTTLTRLPGSDVWAKPYGRHPSTHIIKPSLPTVKDSALIEYLTMKTAKNLGLDVAEVDYDEIGGTPVTIVTRYDRVVDNTGAIQRIHQEDFAQALGVSNERKYSRKRNGLVASDLFRVAAGFGEADAVRFVQGVAFNVACWGTDSHARNYSILHFPDGIHRMAPLYDLISGKPESIQSLIEARTDPGVDTDYWRMALNISNCKDFRHVEENHWVGLAESAGVDSGLVVDTARNVMSQYEDALDATVGQNRGLIKDRKMGMFFASNTVAPGQYEARVARGGVLDTGHAGLVWVRPYYRGDGVFVRGYWRMPRKR